MPRQERDLAEQQRWLGTPGSSEPAGGTETPWNGRRLPATLHLLFIGPVEPSWTWLTLQLERAGCCELHFHWADQLTEAIRQIHRERFDAIVIDDSSDWPRDTPLFPDGFLAFFHALQAGGCESPILVLTDRIDEQWQSIVALEPLESLITRQGWNSPALVPWLMRTLESGRLREESRALQASAISRQTEGRGDSAQLALHWTQLAKRLAESAEDQEALPDKLITHYAALLRTSVIMGTGDLSEEIRHFARELQEEQNAPLKALAAHAQAVNTLLTGLGTRSARHLLDRSALLITELLMVLSNLDRLGSANHGSY